MKKNSTKIIILVAICIAYCTTTLFSQIAGFDKTKYYMIINHNSRNAIGVDDQNSFIPGALIQQQVPNELSDIQLWKVVPVTESTYIFINKNSELALGASTWRDINPFWVGDVNSATDEQKDAQLTVPRFNWRGAHRGIIQVTLNEADPLQIWQPTEFPTNTTIGDTTLYRMTLAMNLVDSGFCFNIWERRVLPGYKNICLFPGTQENDLYIDPTSLYAYFFQKTSQDVPTSVNENVIDKFNIYSSHGNILIEGEIQNKTIEVYSILGNKIYETVAAGSVIHLEAERAIYIVRIGNSVTKIAVR